MLKTKRKPRTIWVIMHKIRSGMGKMDGKYVLEVSVE